LIRRLEPSVVSRPFFLHTYSRNGISVLIPTPFEAVVDHSLAFLLLSDECGQGLEMVEAQM
jgi:hypothetical protein